MALAATDKSTEGLHYCAKAIVEVLRAAGPAVMAEGSPTIYGGIGRDAICAGLAALNLKTAQPPIRVLYYWKKHLINGGWAVKVQAAA